MSNLFELNKYENQVDTLITVCFILSAMSTLATAIAWIGLAACTVLLGLLVLSVRRCGSLLSLTLFLSLTLGFLLSFLLSLFFLAPLGLFLRLLALV